VIGTQAVDGHQDQGASIHAGLEAEGLRGISPEKIACW
jgi:hypothetical protein